MGKDCIRIGLIGLGTIGSGVTKILQEKREAIRKEIGIPLLLKWAADLDERRRDLPFLTPEVFTRDARRVLEDPEVDIVIELIGGEKPARDFIHEAIERGKHVVTANKEVMSKHGPELLALAQSKRVGLYYEASVGGGIPLIRPLKRQLQINDISAIHTIINGTTNYILTRMEREGLEFSAALKEAQSLGYAEANPTSDIEGFDAAYKIAILATIAFHTDVRPQDVYHEGISKVASQDFRYARELGYAIKLLAIAKRIGEAVQVRVHPALLRADMLLAKVDGVFNAIQIEGDLTGRVLFYGHGAGRDTTANVVVTDAVHIAHSIRGGGPLEPESLPDRPKAIQPISELVTRYYIRMTIADKAGVLAQVARAFGDNAISISAAIQKEADARSQTAEIVITTHPAREAAMQQAISQIRGLGSVREVNNVIRVED